jgi:PAS domain S-box-containing protein
MQRQPKGCDVREKVPPGLPPEGAGGRLLGRFLESVPLGVFACDEAGRITYFNAEAARLWGQAPGRGQSLESFCPALGANVLPVSGRGGREVVIRRPDGSAIGVLAFTSDVHDGDGRLLGTVHVFVDLGGRRQAEETLLERERELTDFFENANIGLHWAAQDGTILRANRYELDLLGYEADEYVGHRMHEFHEDPAAADRLLERLRGGENIYNFEARLRCKDGTLRDVLINSNVLWDHGRFVHTRSFTRDITPFRKAGEALILADRRRTEFLSTLAQVLRSPLTTIRSVVGFLGMEGRSDAERRSAREVCDRQLAHVIGIVDDLGDVARIAGGTLRMRKEEVSLAEIIANAVDASRAAVERAGQVLEVNVPDGPVMLQGDAVRLAQVFQNLLGNAARFSPPGGTVTVSARLEPATKGDPAWAVVTVADTGMGIAPDRLPHLFEMFYQDPQDGRRPSEGLGIGLAIARAIVEKHGGRMEVKSEGPGTGSEFLVHLPVAEVPSRPEPGTRRRVLVVDDNEDSAVIMSMLLNYMGHETRTAFAGHAALAAAAEYRPDAVLMDIGLPEIDGYEVCRRIRSQPWGRNMVLVAVTGWGHDEDKQRAREAGFDDHLTKPADLDELRRVLA